MYKKRQHTGSQFTCVSGLRMLRARQKGKRALDVREPRILARALHARAGAWARARAARHEPRGGSPPQLHRNLQTTSRARPALTDEALSRRPSVIARIARLHARIAPSRNSSRGRRRSTKRPLGCKSCPPARTELFAQSPFRRGLLWPRMDRLKCTDGRVGNVRAFQEHRSTKAARERRSST